MTRISWDDFNYKNKDKTTAFENMCRTLFLREMKKGGYDYQYNFNQAGLEFEPVYNNKLKKWCGAQCKYFVTESSTAKYNEIYDSLKKAVKLYRGKLDYVYIYTNAQLQPHCTNDDINTAKSNSSRIQLAKMNRDKVKIIWLQADNIIDLLIEPGNVDLRRMYFSSVREIDLLNDMILIEEKTFLNSEDFFNLRLNSTFFDKLLSNFLDNKLSLILGSAGTGKSMLMKKIYVDLSVEFMQHIDKIEDAEKASSIPILIKLRECVNGNLEELIRQRTNDYNINITQTGYKFVYLLDGLDEVSHYDLSAILNSVNQLTKRSTTKSIVLSSRSDSNNLSYLRQNTSYIEYKIDHLRYSDIELFFSIKNNIPKMEKLNMLKTINPTLLEDITDIFSVDLLWKIIDEVDSNSTKIELIEYYINYWIVNYSKISTLPLLEPKDDAIDRICIEIAYIMQKRLLLHVELLDVYDVIRNMTGTSTATDINMIVNALVDLFFEPTRNGSTVMLSFKHRRFQEYFLYKKINRDYLNSPGILRELHLLPNKDFIINIFLKTSLIKSQKDKDILKCLSLRLMEEYLGYSYWHKYKDNIIGINNSYGSAESFYSHSLALVHVLACYSAENIEDFLSNDNLSISDALNENNFMNFIEVYHRIHNENICEFLSKKYNLSSVKITDTNFYSYIYFLHNLRGVTVTEIYTKYLKNTNILRPEISHMDYVESSSKRLSSFYRLALEFDISYLNLTVQSMSIEQLEVLCCQILKMDNILCLLGNEDNKIELRKQLTARVEAKDEKYLTNTIALYNFISKKPYRYEQLECALGEANCRNFPSWSQNIELHNILCYLLYDKVRYTLREFKLGVDIFKEVANNIENKNMILQQWIEIIKPYNFIYNDWLKYSYSSMLGTLISILDFNIINLKAFFRELMKYESVISCHTVYYTVLKNNPLLFKSLINKHILDRLMSDNITSALEYENSSEIFFQYAAMYSCIDQGMSYRLLIDGINNEILRPVYRGDQLISMILPGCLFFAYQNYWFNEFELVNMFNQLRKILHRLGKITDNGNSFGCFKSAMRICLSKEEVFDDLYDINECDIYQRKSDLVGENSNSTQIDPENIMDYYSCKVKGLPYDSFEFWQMLIQEGNKTDEKLTKLYRAFDDNRYPSRYGYPIIDFIYIPIAVLLLKSETKDQIINYLMEHGGEYGFYNIIRAYSLTGDTYEAKRCIEFLFSFSQMLVESVSPFIKTVNSKEGEFYHTLDSICKSKHEDWDFNETRCTCVLKSNPKIKIVWDDYEDRRGFHEEWATSHPDKNAYLYHYHIYRGEEEIKHFSLISVDGHRAMLPMPRINTNIVKREDYLLSRLFNSRIETLNDYMRSSKLIVE